MKRPAREERGATLVLFSLAVAVMLTMSALVFDLSQLRADRRVNKSTADMAVRAGLGVLHVGPWSGVCRAFDYLKTNTRFSDFDPGSERWFQLGSPVSDLTSSPCLNTTGLPFLQLCLPGQLGVPRADTWGRLTATAGGGRYSIEIQSGYTMPDARFAEDVVAAADTGDLLKGACDNLVVIIKERRSALFAGVTDKSDKTTTVRSVGRISNIDTGDYSPALLLLERHGCAVLTTSGANTRVIAQPYLDHAGVLQLDSADDEGGCTSNQAVLRGQAGPSIVACSASILNPSPGCNPALADKPSRVGIFALNRPHPAGDFVTSEFGTTYGDVEAVPAAQSGRAPIDGPYRNTIRLLDEEARSVITGNSGKPPGCTTITDSWCTGTDGAWLVLQQADCDSYASFFTSAPLLPLFAPPRTEATRIWFNCNLTVTPSLLLPAGLVLTAPDTYVVVTGKLSVNSTLALLDPRRVYIGGSPSTGVQNGLDIGNGGNFNVGNPTPGVDCLLTSPMLKYTTVVVGNGAFNMGSGGRAHLCGTSMLLASGYGRVPATDGTEPCTSPCSTYNGALSIGSGSHIDWSAPNLVTTRRATLFDRQTTSPLEDVALWTEAGGSGNGINGGGDSNMTGVYFLGNANAFSLSGNAGANVRLSAQFIARRMVVSGGAVVNLVLNPLNSVPLVVYELILVR